MISKIIAGLTVMTLGVVPIIPTELTLYVAFQYPVTYEKYIPASATSTERYVTEVTNPHLDFVDNDNNGVISVAAFRDSQGNFAYVQIPDGRYEAMGRKGGVRQNPTRQEFSSLFGLIENADAAIADDNTNNASTDTATSITFAHEVLDNTNGAILVCIAVNAAGSTGPSSVTYDGNTLNKQAEQTDTNDFDNHLSVWGKTSVSTGSANVVANFGSARAYAISVSYTGVDQSDPWGGSGNAAGNSTSPSAPLTTDTDGSTVLGCVATNGQNPTPSGLDELLEFQSAHTGHWEAAGDKTVASAGGTTVDWTIGSTFWHAVGVEIHGAAAATPETQVIKVDNGSVIINNGSLLINSK